MVLKANLGIILALLLLFGFGCEVQTKVKIESRESGAIPKVLPPEVTRGDPVTFKKSALDPQPWKKKTIKSQISTWFLEREDGLWWIDWDGERKPFTKIVIHHSATSPETTASQIDAIQRERLYVPRYNMEAGQLGGDDPYVKGIPIHSNHVIAGKERFIGYHHLVYSNGQVTTELSPLIKVKGQWLVDMVGWHAGRWEVNCESIGICLVGDYTNSDPPKPALDAVKGLITYYRKFNPNLTIHPHSQFKTTSCPGNTWDSWRKKIEQ